MDTPIVDTARHYDLLIEEIDDPVHPATDPFHDEGNMEAWMAQADNAAFYQALGDPHGKTMLEVGIGTGRVARKVLDLGCAHLVGLDISAKTLARARENLAAYPQVELHLCSAESFVRENTFDCTYSAWTFFHIQDKRRALANIVQSLKPGGRLVLSLETVDEWLDYGSRKIHQFPIPIAQYVDWLTDLGCTVAPVVTTNDSFDDGLIFTILRAEKPEA